MTLLVFKCIVFVTYIQSLWLIKSQYTEIWYDDMQQNNGWTPTGDVQFAYDSSSCTSGLCILLTYDGGRSEETWIRRETDVSQYSSLQFQYDVVLRSQEDDDECRVYYSYTDSTLGSRIKIHSISGSTSDGRTYYLDQEVILPDASSANTVWIWLESWGHGSGEDYCYYDNAHLNGIQDVATLTTTKQPTDTQIGDPTESPTPAPSSVPTLTETLSCGDSRNGVYQGNLVTFIINIPYDASDIVFDTTASDFTVTSIEATSILGTVLLGSSTDPVLSISDVESGNYKVVIAGDQTGTYHVQLICTSKSPTAAPTSNPTDNPTLVPTDNPTDNPTLVPTDNPTEAPTDTLKSEVTTVYIVTVKVCDGCDFDEDDITTKVGDAFSDFDVFITNVYTVDDTVTMDVSIKTERDNILNEKNMEDDIERELETIHPEAKVHVIRRGSTATETPKHMALEDYTVTLTVIGCVCLCSCCVLCLWVYRRHIRHKEIIAQQIGQLNKMRGPQQIKQGMGGAPQIDYMNQQMMMGVNKVNNILPNDAAVAEGAKHGEEGEPGHHVEEEDENIEDMYRKGTDTLRDTKTTTGGDAIDAHLSVGNI